MIRAKYKKKSTVPGVFFGGGGPPGIVGNETLCHSPLTMSFLATPVTELCFFMVSVTKQFMIIILLCVFLIVESNLTRKHSPTRHRRTYRDLVGWEKLTNLIGVVEDVFTSDYFRVGADISIGTTNALCCIHRADVLTVICYSRIGVDASRCYL